MGHIDHGKTTLLDKIRQTSVAARESGGITQHIGAVQVTFKAKEGREERITFIDTPGHAAFAQMRARGAQVTDLVVLVVAADDGVMPQTKESLSHIKAAKVPFLVAINKIDLPNASVDKVKGQLAEIDVVPEDYGGKIITVPVSAQSGQGVEDLLEMIVLVGKVADLKADLEGVFEGVVIESSLDRRRGPVGTVLVKNGTLRLRDEIWVGEIKAKVKAMFDDQGKPIESAPPSFPVEVLGFAKPPLIGGKVTPHPGQTEPDEPKKKKEEELDPFAQKKEIPIIIKSDVQGTLEAVLVNLPSEVKVIHSGVGEVTDSDVFLAQASGAQLFSFRAKVGAPAKKIAQESEMEIKEFTIIYDLLEEIEAQVLRLIEPKIDQQVLGEAQIVAEFKIEGKRIAGCRVGKGTISLKGKAYLRRGKKMLDDVNLVSMKYRTKDIKKADKGEEFGVLFEPEVDFRVGDVIVSYKLPKS